MDEAEDRMRHAISATALMTVKLVSPPPGEPEGDFDVIIGGIPNPTPLELAMRLAAIAQATTSALEELLKANPEVGQIIEAASSAPPRKDMN